MPGKDAHIWADLPIEPIKNVDTFGEPYTTVNLDTMQSEECPEGWAYRFRMIAGQVWLTWEGRTYAIRCDVTGNYRAVAHWVEGKLTVRREGTA